MNRFITFLIVVMLSLESFAQIPEKMSYQAVIRNAAGELVKTKPIGMRISILQGSVDGLSVFAESHESSTNANGLASIEIGAGNPLSGSFSEIDWASGPYFLKTETDPEGGVDYTISGTSQLLSVPYALHAKTADKLSGELMENDPVFGSSVAAGITATDTARWNTTQDSESDPVFNAWDKSNGISISKSQISDLGNVIETETDPVFSGSVAAKITAHNIMNWNMSLSSESDPVYKKSLAAGISEVDTARWNNSLSLESDPNFKAWDKSTGISITESQISDLDHFTNADETDPVYSSSEAANINATDITNLSNLSGTNTGDQDISGISMNTQAISDTAVAIFIAIADTASSIRSEIPKIKSYSVGDFAQGGIVFWIDETGQHGLVCAKKDQDGGSGIQWYNGSFTTTSAIGNGVYAGEMNTLLIIANQGAILTDYAAGVCVNYSVTQNSVLYGDWYLPSEKELNLMYQNKATIDATATTNGGSSFASAYYWSSTEITTNGAWGQYFANGNQYYNSKLTTFRVRAVRAF